MVFKNSTGYSKDLIKGSKIEVFKKKLVMPFGRYIQLHVKFAIIYL